MRRLVALGGAMVFLIGVLVGVSSSHDATAQDASSDQIATLQTQVAELQQHDETLLNNYYQLANKSLPGQDPNGYWLGAKYIYDQQTYQFPLYCTIGQTSGQYATDYILKCTQPKPNLP